MVLDLPSIGRTELFSRNRQWSVSRTVLMRLVNKRVVIRLIIGLEIMHASHNKISVSDIRLGPSDTVQINTWCLFADEVI